MYNPRPIETGTIYLTPEMILLTEKISENIHDVWGRKRMDEGWQWGPSRDDKKQTSPCLVSYRDLPESEKEYDRSMVLETIKLIIALGYTIEKKVSPENRNL